MNDSLADFLLVARVSQTEILQHFCHVRIGVVVACAKSRCLSLNSLQLLNVFFVVGIPCGTSIFEGWSD